MNAQYTVPPSSFETLPLFQPAPALYHLLAYQEKGDEVCLKCHVGYALLAGSPHDLRMNHPGLPNLFGVSTGSGGACRGCHDSYGYARPIRTGPFDLSGLCRTCHDTGQPAERKQLGNWNHPAGCTICHDPHETRYGSFLRAPAHRRCLECHSDRAQLTSGPHDLRTNRGNWPAQAAETQDICLACHRPHGNARSGLFRVASPADAEGVDFACAGCHSETARNASSPRGLRHPLQAEREQIPPELPVVSTGNNRARLGCRTCHDPHADPQASPRLLRTEPGEDAFQLCLRCHRDKSGITLTGHARDSLQASGLENQACGPCHEVHNWPELTADRLWPTCLNDGVTPPTDPTEITDPLCRACHRPDGPVAPPETATHPLVQMFNPLPPERPGFLPLFDTDGEVDPQGFIGCRTCHLTHGRTTASPVWPYTNPTQRRELRARRYHLRTFAAGNVCTTCHGLDALRRFLYFHDPQRRRGPIVDQRAGRSP